MKNVSKLILIAYALILFVSVAGCPHRQSAAPPEAPPPNPSFFRDTMPDQGPWAIKVRADKNMYQKLYANRSSGAFIWATFTRFDERINIDITDPRNQKALAEIALQSFCKAQEQKCLVMSSDMAWIVGTPFKYIYVRFNAEKAGYPQLRGLVYYRFDQPFQTMYIFMADAKVYDNYETVFLNYLSKANFSPEKF